MRAIGVIHAWPWRYRLLGYLGSVLTTTAVYGAMFGDMRHTWLYFGGLILMGMVNAAVFEPVRP